MITAYLLLTQISRWNRASKDVFADYVGIVKNYVQIMMDYVLLTPLSRWVHIYNDVVLLRTHAQRTASERDCLIRVPVAWRVGESVLS